jgi:hypothetical protein
MSKLDLAAYHGRLREVLKTRYDDTFDAGFRAIEDRYKTVGYSGPRISDQAIS